jgi:hypothetical protein
MSLSDFKLDTTLNVEGIIAAIAILGAAIGFIINLIKKWRLDYKEKKYRGTNFIILDLLESNFQNGLSEDKLWELYCSSETSSKRKSFSAFRPERLKRIGFEGQLKHLQSKFLIRLTGPAHYHIDFKESRDWENFNRRNNFLKIVERIKNEIGENDLNEILNQSIKNSDRNFYRIKDTYRFLLEGGDGSAIAKIVSEMRHSDAEIRKNAIELFIELTNETK